MSARAEVYGVVALTDPSVVVVVVVVVAEGVATAPAGACAGAGLTAIGLVVAVPAVTPVVVLETTGAGGLTLGAVALAFTPASIAL